MLVRQQQQALRSYHLIEVVACSKVQYNTSFFMLSVSFTSKHVRTEIAMSKFFMKMWNQVNEIECLLVSSLNKFLVEKKDNFDKDPQGVLQSFGLPYDYGRK
jgi:hypothetical protein